MNGLLLEDLDERDAAQNVALSRSVGWKDAEAEWRVLHRAGRVRGVRRGHEVVAQGVLGDYGNCACVAKMVVATELQGKGIGAGLLDGFLEIADGRGLPVGLCATESGRPLYASRGFVESGAVAVLVGSATPGMEEAASAVSTCTVDRVIALDADFSGCDRGRMLRARGAESSVVLQHEQEGGFVLAQDLGEYWSVGPLCCESEGGARSLLRGVMARAAGKLRLDVPLEHTGFRAWLVELGFAELGHRVEMARGATRVPWQTASRFALASQAWG
jgi:GNAT superfamily N-acetyltransferase